MKYYTSIMSTVYPRGPNRCWLTTLKYFLRIRRHPVVVGRVFIIIFYNFSFIYLGIKTVDFNSCYYITCCRRCIFRKIILFWTVKNLYDCFIHEIISLHPQFKFTELWLWTSGLFNCIYSSVYILQLDVIIIIIFIYGKKISNYKNIV